MNPDKDRCLANIYMLAKKKGLLIRDLETACGVSVGYLARFRQDQRQVLPGSDFLFRASALLNVSVDSLVSFDYRLASDTESYLHSFISKMISDTVADKLAWQPDPAVVPSPFVSEDKCRFPDHPLLTLDPDLNLRGQSKEIYLSPFHPADKDIVPLGAWQAFVEEDVSVLLVSVSWLRGGKEAGSPRKEVEMYLYDRKLKKLSALCHTDSRSPGILDHDLSELYDTVEMMFRTRPLEESVRGAIDRYMQNGASR